MCDKKPYGNKLGILAEKHTLKSKQQWMSIGNPCTVVGIGRVVNNS